MKTLAVIVNYKVADLTLKAVASVLDSESMGPVQVAVIDNSEDEREADFLRRSLPRGVTLEINRENKGFGRACNQAALKFEGEMVLLLNPDAVLLPGCLLRLQKTLLANEKAGAVGPLIYWDPDFKYLLPPSYPPMLFLFQPAFAAWSPESYVRRGLSFVWRNRSIRVWRAKRPVKAGNLSGGHVLLKREAVEKAGGLFDPRFFLYFEDADLFLRLRQSGFHLFVEPRAAVVHAYDQSGRKDPEKRANYMEHSHGLFRMKHGRGWKRCLEKALMDLGLGFNDEWKPGEADFTAPFELSVPKAIQDGWLFEWSPNPDIVPAAGRFGQGPLMDLSEKDWSMLSPGRYFGRLGGAQKFARGLKLVSWIVHGKVHDPY